MQQKRLAMKVVWCSEDIYGSMKMPRTIPELVRCLCKQEERRLRAMGLARRPRNNHATREDAAGRGPTELEGN